jgi:beta-galactosidase
MYKKVFLYSVWLLLALACRQANAQATKFVTDRFLYGASVYPEFQSKEEQIKMLDLFEKAHITVLRVAESSWGNLEPASGKFNFRWLRDFLDEMQKRNMKAILGTSSYIVPQWLAANHPEILWQYADGSHAHPMGRHSVSRTHPLFRAELEKFILAMGREFKDHPAVIGWQLDNEIESNIGFRTDYNKVTKNAWTQWLKKNFGTKEEFNRRLNLVQWGLQIDSFQNVFLPSKSNDGDLPALRLAHIRFQKDDVMEYFRWQRALLEKAGVKHWITTDLNTVYHTIADEPRPDNPFDIMGLNEYQPTEDNPGYWASQAMYHDIHRSSNNNGTFLITETRIGPAGSERIWNAAASHKQFVAWMLHPAAFGASGLLHWSGNRFTGGHWPHWGGILDWRGEPEPDYKWVQEIGAFYKQWGKVLVSTSVKAKAAVITDFEQRAMLDIYPHTPSKKSTSLLAEAFDAFHRNGIGVDALHPTRAMQYQNLKNYGIIIIAAAPSLNSSTLLPALKQFVEAGGTLIIAPFTGYQTADGVFRNNGFATDLTELTGTLVKTVRLLGEQKDNSAAPKVKLVNQGKTRSFKVGMEGFAEIIESKPDVQVIGRFRTNEDVMNGLPAITVMKTGKGKAYKLAFWPTNNEFTSLVTAFSPAPNTFLKHPLPAGVQAVPRSDNSLFIINTIGMKVNVALYRPVKDRITKTTRSINFTLQPYELVWLD